MSWAFASSRYRCVLSWQDLMTSISWAKAKHSPISVHARSPWSHSSPRTSPTLHTPRTHLLVVPPKANRQGAEKVPPNPSAVAEPARRDREGTGGWWPQPWPLNSPSGWADKYSFILTSVSKAGLFHCMDGDRS